MKSAKIIKVVEVSEAWCKLPLLHFFALLFTSEKIQVLHLSMDLYFKKGRVASLVILAHVFTKNVVWQYTVYQSLW